MLNSFLYNELNCRISVYPVTECLLNAFLLLILHVAGHCVELSMRIKTILKESNTPEPFELSAINYPVTTKGQATRAVNTYVLCVPKVRKPNAACEDPEDNAYEIYPISIHLMYLSIAKGGQRTLEKVGLTI